jgi:hypothetical protein
LLLDRMSSWCGLALVFSVMRGGLTDNCNRRLLGAIASTTLVPWSRGAWRARTSLSPLTSVAVSSVFVSGLP